MRAPPGPRAHLAGTLRLVERFAAAAGGHPELPTLRRLLDRPQDLPAAVPARDNALKYDAYLAAGERGVAWGVTINDRWEPAALRRELEPVAAAWGAELDRLLPWTQALAGAAPVLTVAAGFDHPERRPRLKLYLQEDAWGRGLAAAHEIDRLLEPLGVSLPAWLPQDRRIGVLTLQLRGRDAAAKVYLGARSARGAAAGSPQQDLAARFGELCPLAGYYYLTVRLDPGAPARYAINKVYNPVQIGFDRPALWARAWAEIAGIFDAAGRGGVFDQIDGVVRELGAEGVAVVPTATAFEDGGASADLYCAAWRVRG